MYPIPMNEQHPAGTPDHKEEPLRQAAHNVASTVHQGPEAIEKRLGELDREWTIGRLVKVITSVGIFVGLGLAWYVNVAWLALPILLGLLLLQYAFSRHSLLTYLFRPLGFRLGMEVEHERIALKALRGDFRHLPTIYDKHDQEALARMAGEGGPANEDLEPIRPDSKEVAHQVFDVLKH